MSHFLSQYPPSNTFLPSPILTFIVILILPSCLTFVTLLIHRVRMARAAQRDRAPELLVKSLPWRVWNGTAWEKHKGSTPHPHPSPPPSSPDIEAADQSPSRPSGSHDPIPWCETQLECAICLFEFVKGDRVRELPCHHIFHLDEVDTWLINRKKFVRLLPSSSSLPHPSSSSSQCPVCKADVTQPWQLSLAKKPLNTVSTSNTNRFTASSPTERTPLLHDRYQEPNP